MPLFVSRLQLRILRDSDDESIFAWTALSSQYPTGSRSNWGTPVGMLAKSPAAFYRSSQLVAWRTARRAPYAMTNKGLEMKTFMVPEMNGDIVNTERFLMPLNCMDRISNRQLAVGLYSIGPERYMRLQRFDQPGMFVYWSEDSDTRLGTLGHDQPSVIYIHVK